MFGPFQQEGPGEHGEQTCTFAPRKVRWGHVHHGAARHLRSLKWEAPVTGEAPSRLAHSGTEGAREALLTPPEF